MFMIKSKLKEKNLVFKYKKCNKYFMYNSYINRKKIKKKFP